MKYCQAVAHGNQKVSFGDNLENKVWGKKWEHPVVTFRLNNLSEDFNKKWQPRVVTEALMFWQWRIKDIRFKRIRDPEDYVDMNVNFLPSSDFESQGVFARAYYPGQGSVSGNVEINDGWDWVPTVNSSTLGRAPLLPIMIHEFGHSIGLTHDVLEREAIMYPSFDLGKKKTHLHTSDISRIQEIYGARSIPQRIIDMWRKRAFTGSYYKK